MKKTLEMIPLHFVGANGFPSRCYGNLFDYIVPQYITEQNDSDKNRVNFETMAKEKHSPISERDFSNSKATKFLHVQTTDVYGDDCVYNFPRTPSETSCLKEGNEKVFKRCAENYQTSWQSSIDKIIQNIERQTKATGDSILDQLSYDLARKEYKHINGTEEINLQNFQNKQEKVIGFGHSMGGAMMYIAAVQRPDLFKKIIIWDPPMFNIFHRALMAIIPTLFPPVMKKHPLIKSTYRKKQMFTCKEEALDYFSSRRLFSKFSTSTLEKLIIPMDVYLSSIDQRTLNEFKDLSTKYRYILDYDGNAERFFYLKTPYDIIPNIKGGETNYYLGQYNPLASDIELIFVYSSQYYLQTESDIKYLKTYLAPESRKIFIPYNGSHFYPLEDSKGTYEKIKNYLI